MDHDGSPKRPSFSPSAKSDVFRVDIFSMNGKPFAHKFTAKDVKELWSKGLGRQELEVIGQSSSWISKNVLRVNIQLSRELSIKEVTPTLEFTFVKESVFQNQVYECKIAGIGKLKEAEIGDVVRITLKRVHFRFKPEKAVDWLSKYGKILSEPRFVLLSVFVCLCVFYTVKPIHFYLRLLVGRIPIIQLLAVWGSSFTVRVKFTQLRLLAFVLGLTCLIYSCWLLRLNAWESVTRQKVSTFNNISILQLSEGFRRTPNRSDSVGPRTSRINSRMASNVWLQNPRLLPQDLHTMQQVLGSRPSGQTMSGRLNEVGEICRQDDRFRKI